MDEWFTEEHEQHDTEGKKLREFNSTNNKIVERAISYVIIDSTSFVSSETIQFTVM